MATSKEVRLTVLTGCLRSIGVLLPGETLKEKTEFTHILQRNGMDLFAIDRVYYGEDGNVKHAERILTVPAPRLVQRLVLGGAVNTPQYQRPNGGDQAAVRRNCRVRSRRPKK